MSETRCTVQERTWKDELPSLPDDVSALLAPPVVVRFDTVAAGAPRRTSIHPSRFMDASPAESSRGPGRANPRAAAHVG